MEMKNEKPREVTDSRKSPAEFRARIKTMKEKKHK